MTYTEVFFWIFMSTILGIALVLAWDMHKDRE